MIIAGAGEGGPDIWPGNIRRGNGGSHSVNVDMNINTGCRAVLVKGPAGDFSAVNSVQEA